MSRILFAALLVAMRATGGQLSPLFSSPVVITATTVDAANNLYVAGYVNFPNGTSGVVGAPTTPGAYLPQPECPAGSACGFVVKISSSGALLFGTYLDNMDPGNTPTSIAVDSAGNVLVAGQVYVATALPFSVTGFVDKLGPDGTKLLGSYQVAGGVPAAIALAPSGGVFITGQAGDPHECNCQFMTTAGAFQSTTQGLTDAFVIQLDAALSKPIYSTLVGGAGYDAALAIAVDAAGEAYITGWTLGPSTFPVTPGALSSPGSSFVVKLRADGSAPVFSALYDFVTPANESPATTFFTVASAIAVDGSGVYIAGVKSPDGFTNSQFAAKLTPDGSSLLYQISLPELASHGFGVPVTPMEILAFRLAPTLTGIPPLLQIAPDSAGDLLIIGPTDVNLSVTSNAFAWCSPVLVGSRFLMELSATGAVSYESYLPGGLAIRGDGEVWFADTSGAVHTFNANDPLPPSVRCVADAFTGLSGPIAPGKLVLLMGPGIGPDVPATEQIDGSGKVAVGLNGVNVYFNGIAAPLLSASSSQIEAVVPFENLDPVEFPTSTVAILKNGVEIDGLPVPVVAIAPELLQDAQGCISGFNFDGTLISSTNPAALGSFIAIFGEGAGLMNPAITGGIGNGQSRIAAPGMADASLPGAVGLGLPKSLPLTILYAGDVPGFVEGLFELNMQLPNSFPSAIQQPGRYQVNVMIGNSPVLSSCVWLKPAN